MIVKSGFQNKPVTPVASASWGDHISNFCTLPLLYVQETCHPVHIGARWQRQLPVLCHNLGHGYFFCEQTTLLSTKLFLYFRGKTNPHFSYLQPLEFLLNRRAVATNGRFAPRHQRSLRGAGREGAARRLQLPHLAQLGRHHGAVTTAPWQQAGAGTKKHQTKCHVYRFIQGLI